MAKFVRGKKVIGCQIGGGLLKMQSLGEVFMMPDNTVELLPIELIPLEDGRVVFRVGNTTYWFAADGSYEGAEMNVLCVDPLYEENVLKLGTQARKNIGREPEPYFRE